MPKRAVFKRSRRELSFDVSVGVHILLVVEQLLSLESQFKGCAKTPILLTIFHDIMKTIHRPVDPGSSVGTS